MSGTLMAAEMAEQPQVLERMLRRREEITGTVRDLLPPALSGVTFVARGSSDNAAVYGRYLCELASGRPAGLAAPSLLTRYGETPDYRGQLVVGLSQSGRTPEIVDVCERLAAAGGRVIAVTNDAASPLAGAAHGTIALEAGAERAVPATKTVLAQMLAVLLIALSLGEVPSASESIDEVPGAVAATLGDSAAMDLLAPRWSGYRGVLVVARGLTYGAALEVALKVREVAAVHAQALSAADLLHGPIASMASDLPVLLLDGGGRSAQDLRAVRERLRALDVPHQRCSAPLNVPEALTPFPLTARGQQLARAWALAVGRDPDVPPGLSKVTLTD